jgi:protoporphyrinogen oxidase
MNKVGLDDTPHDLLLAGKPEDQKKIKGRVAVIGAGVAGLAAARKLALQGAQVDVFEALPDAGGFCSTITLEGYNFDLGPHLFARPILHLAPFKPGDLEPENYSESFLLNNHIREFPKEVVFDGYLGDLMITLIKNTFSAGPPAGEDFERVAERAFGAKVTREIFKPMIEKWCAAELSELDPRYMQSRIHSKVTPAMAARFAKDFMRGFWKRNVAGDSPEKAPEAKGIYKKLQTSPAPSYAGIIGAKIIPLRFMDRAPGLRVHCDSPLKAIGVSKGIARWVEAGDHRVETDYVINTAPLNDLANAVVGARMNNSLKELSYLDILFIMCRIAKPKLLDAKWTWIPSRKRPFYRMSEMKTINKRHAPPGSTGICLEATFRRGDPDIHKPDKYWKHAGAKFLKDVFSLREGDIIGMDIIRRNAAYPRFTKENCSRIDAVLKTPYKPYDISHDFDLGIRNLSCAGRPGEFIYLLAPPAIRSGIRASRDAINYLSDNHGTETG